MSLPAYNLSILDFKVFPRVRCVCECQLIIYPYWILKVSPGKLVRGKKAYNLSILDFKGVARYITVKSKLSYNLSILDFKAKRLMKALKLWI